MDARSIRRQLKIKVGVVKRLHKEHIMYKTETVEQQAKLDKLAQGGGEEWDIKNARRMLEESNKMINDSGARLGKAVGELQDLVVAVEGVPELNEDEELNNAEQVLKEVEQ